MLEERFCSNGWKMAPVDGGEYRTVGPRKVWTCRKCLEGRDSKTGPKKKKPIRRYETNAINYLGSIR